MTLEKAFGSALKILRQEKGLSQEKLADISGFHRTYISLLERGIKSPSLATLHRLSQALDITLTQLIMVVENTKEDEKL